MEKLEFTIGEETYLWGDMIITEGSYDKQRDIEQRWKGRSFISKDRTNIIHYGDSEYGFQDIAGSGDHEEYNELFFNLKKKEVWIELNTEDFDSELVYLRETGDKVFILEDFYLKVKEAYERA